MVVQNNKNEIRCISKGGPIQTWINHLTINLSFNLFNVFFVFFNDIFIDTKER